MDGIAAADSVTFGPWRFDRRLGRLWHDDGGAHWVPVSLGSRAADILGVLSREPGALVSKDQLMDAVWPGVTVEANNLTVQVAALRRILDEGIAGPSWIQTVPGRGYRLLCRVGNGGGLTLPLAPLLDSTPSDITPPEIALPDTTTTGCPATLVSDRRRFGIGAAILLSVLLAVAGYLAWPGRVPALPRMSALVMPFENLGGPEDAKIAAALTDDLKAALSLTAQLQIVNAKVPQSPDDEKRSIGAIGRKFGARYVITGSARQVEGVMRVNAQIVAAETSAVLWTDRFDLPRADLASAQEQAIYRLQRSIFKALIPIEAARSQLERPIDPDAFDLFLSAMALELIPPTPSRSSEIRGLYERALQLEPSSAIYRLRLVAALLDEEDQNPHGRKAVYERTASLLAEAQIKDPGLWLFAYTKLYWFAWQEHRRCPEVVDLAERYIVSYPGVVSGGGERRWLSVCQAVLGHADIAVTLMNDVLPLRSSPYESRDYRNLQFALLLLGRLDESIQAGERALARNPNDVSFERARLNRRLAAAHALSGRVDEARRKLADADRIDPSTTLRSVSAFENASPEFAVQYARYIEGLRLAGLRDHADEDADFGATADQRIHQESQGHTPLTLPGVETIRTGALVDLLADRHPVVIDALTSFAGRSIPGAVGLRYVGAGGELTDLAQDRLRTTMRDLTKGDLNAPIVAVGWNSESFDGPNLALRLSVLGYTHVSWYRGGREAWEVGGLPEAVLTPRDW